MSVAFPALLILLLVFPGIAFRYSYQRGSWANSPYYVASLADEIGYSVFLAGLLHSLWWLVSWPIGAHYLVEPDFRSLLILLVGAYGPDQVLLNQALDSVTRHPALIAWYFLSLYAAALGLGFAAHKVVRSRKLDWKYKYLRFRNEWYYLFSAEVLRFAENAENNDTNESASAGDEVLGVYLSAVVTTGGTPYLYRGLIHSYYYNRTGDLDRIVLSSAHRRALSEDRKSGQSHSPLRDERYYDIAGNLFVLRMSEFQTLNIQYIIARKMPDEASDSGSALAEPDAVSFTWEDSSTTDVVEREPDE
jgi:hypothetical protein